MGICFSIARHSSNNLVAIADVEKDASSGSSIFPAFTSIINNLTCLDVENSGDTVLAIKDRWTDLLSPLIAISFLLDPKMMLRHHYDEEVRALALRFLQDNYDNEEVIELWASLNSYLYQDNGFEAIHFSSPNLNISSINWRKSCLLSRGIQS